MELLQHLTSIHAPSGNEGAMKDFIVDYVHKNADDWRVQPAIYQGEGFQDCLVLVFGEPRTAIFAHMDSVGYTVGYNGQLEKNGKPSAKAGAYLVGEDSEGPVECELQFQQEDESDKPTPIYIAERSVEPGTTLTYKPNFRQWDDYIQSPYIDNRGGVYNALKVAETLENGIICFSCWEEHGGGSVGYLGRFIFEKFGVCQALIADITWATESIHHGKGTAISLRDSGIPRKQFVNQVLDLAKQSQIPFQREVEGAGGSDGIELQKSPYPFDWCFVGAPESNVHSPDEQVHKDDLDSMVKMYGFLMQHL